MISWLKPAAFAAPLPPVQVDPTYRRLRRRVFLGIFAGYAAAGIGVVGAEPAKKGVNALVKPFNDGCGSRCTPVLGLGDQFS